MPGVLFAKGNCAAKQTEFEWIAADGRTGVLYLRALHQSEDHEPLYHGIAGIDRPYDAFLATLQRFEGHCLQSLLFPLLTTLPQMITILICGRNR